MVDRELCIQAADRALAYLRERVLDDTWVAAHRDIAYYFKAPQAFLLAGLRDEAAAAFDALEPFLDEGGAASGAVPASLETGPMTIAELKEELTRRGVKFYARDRKHVLRAKLDACLSDESCATSR